MSRNKEKKLSLSMEYGGQRSAPAAFLSGLIPLVPMHIGLCLAAGEVFGSMTVQWWLLAILAVALSGGFLLLYGCSFGRYVLPGAVVLTVAVCAAFNAPVLGGARELLNDVITKMTAVTGRIYLDYEAGGDTLPALIPLTVLCSALLSMAAYRGSLIPALPILLPMLAGSFLGIVPAGAAWVLIFAGAAMLVGCGGHSGAAVGIGRLVAVIVCGAVALGAAGLMQKLPVDGWKESVQEKIHSARYDSESNSMPEGELKNLGPWRKNDTQALRVTMEQPQKVYLRGAVYDEYTGSAWKKAENKTLAESEDIFYWLHENGFYSQSQIARALELTGEEEQKSMTVENLSACSEHGYIPYAFCGSDGLDKWQIGDIKTGSDVTQFKYIPGSIPMWFGAQHLLTESQRQEDVAQYRVLEQAYGDFVTELDLQMTEESWNAMKRALGDVSGNHSLAEIQNRIRSYLTTHLTYNENIYTRNGSTDFLGYVLERSKAGYSVQYATAAVMMLRYYGVPARYVEGYYLSPEEASQLQAGDSAVLTEENAHAWAEYYLNGIGFVPFEVTPGYVDPQDLDFDGADDSGANSMIYSSNSLAYAETKQPEVEEKEDEDRAAPTFKPIMLLLLIPLVLIALAIWVTVRRLRLRRALRYIDQTQDNREAVTMRYGYAMLLKRRCGASVEGEERAGEINREAMFSRHDVTDEQRDFVDRYAQDMLGACRKQWSPWQRLKGRLIDVIY